MADPIRPEDHSIGGRDVFAAVAAATRSDRLPAQDHALIEAIHQCFERDVDRIESIRLYKESRRNLTGTKAEQQEQADEIDRMISWLKAGGSDDGTNTEIDRLARLIVDGEYRRRASTEDES